MREVSRCIEMQKTRPPLEGVERTKDRMDRLGVGRIRLQNEHALFDGLEQLEGLGMELAKQLKVFLQIQRAGRFVFLARSCDRDDGGSHRGDIVRPGPGPRPVQRPGRQPESLRPGIRDRTHVGVPLVEPADAGFREFTAPVEDLIDPAAGDLQSLGPRRGDLVPPQLLEIEQEMIDGEQPVVFPRHHKGQFLTDPADPIGRLGRDT